MDRWRELIQSLMVSNSVESFITRLSVFSITCKKLFQNKQKLACGCWFSCYYRRKSCALLMLVIVGNLKIVIDGS